MGTMSCAVTNSNSRRRETAPKRAGKNLVMIVSFQLVMRQGECASLVGRGFSVEREPVLFQIGRKCRALGLRGLTRLVFGPSVERCLAELGIRPVLLLRDAVARIASPVIVVDGRWQAAVVIAVTVRGRASGQAKADEPVALRIAEAETRD